MKKWIKKLRAKWILYRIRRFKRYKRPIKVSITKGELKQAFTSPEALDNTISNIIERVYNEGIKDFIRLRLEAGELSVKDVINAYGEADIIACQDIFDKYDV